MKNSPLKRKQTSKRSLAANTIAGEAELLAHYITTLKRMDVPAAFIEELDLENTFYWVFHLSELIAIAYRRFHEINDRHYAGTLATPQIAYCKRTTGGFYNPKKHLIGISLAMTIEFGESEFFETLLHEIAHIKHRKHNEPFYKALRMLGGNGRKAPVTVLLREKRKRFVEKNYPVIVECPSCKRQSRYKTRRALKYACARCCKTFAQGKFDTRFLFKEVAKLEAS